MALLIPSITLSSGIELTNVMAVISDLNVSNNVSASERLDVVSSPGEGDAINEHYQIVTTSHGGKNASFMVSVFMNEQAFNDGKPPIEQLKEGRSTKVFSVNLLADEYKELEARTAAYSYLAKQAGFLDSLHIESVAV
ncbi:hypothetical protein [Shewanella sp.]|uniref:hypothetical protein n=1 Tax=Shewanella sp. TaxID=50422 RepID=UPI0040474E7B